MSNRLARPSIHPKQSADSTTSAYVTDGTPAPFLASFTYTPGAVPPSASSHASNAAWSGNASTGRSVGRVTASSWAAHGSPVQGAVGFAEGRGGYSFDLQERRSHLHLGRITAVTEELGGGFWVRYAAYRPDGSRAGYALTRPEAARLLLPLSAQAEETLAAMRGAR